VVVGWFPLAKGQGEVPPIAFVFPCAGGALGSASREISLSARLRPRLGLIAQVF